jgi:hypothetical protein
VTWTLYSDFRIDVSGCGPKTPVTASADVIARLSALAYTVAPYAVELPCNEPIVYDGIGFGLTVYGRGARAASKEEKLEIQQLVSQVDPEAYSRAARGSCP